TGENTYTGGTAINNGTINLGSAGDFGSIMGHVTVNHPGNLAFVNSTTDTITGITNSGNVHFTDGTNAGSVTIANHGGYTNFGGTANAGTATIDGGYIRFNGTSSGGNATLSTPSVILFYDDSTAGHANITTNSGGELSMQGRSTAG